MLQIALGHRIVQSVWLALCLSACASSLGEPTVKPLPAPDPMAPLLGAVTGPLSPRIANYAITARFDPSQHRITATQTLTWTNTSQRRVADLPFHLYMNAFKNDTSVFMRESRGRHRSASAAAGGWGWIELSSVTIGGVELVDKIEFPGQDETVAKVPLSVPLAPGETIHVRMAFEVQLPEVFARTGYKGQFHMIGQWFPKIGVLIGDPGNETWHCETFHLNSEFFADFGTYEVILTVPSTHVIAATGVLAASRDNGDGTYTLTYRAEDVHDFSWMADPHMKMMSAPARTENGEVEVRVYYRPRQEDFARRHLRAGVGSIEEFSRRLVAYPWPRMSIIDPPPDAAEGAGGMEYPTLVTTAGDSFLMPEGVYAPEFVTVHEVGHNWFQGILASNEVDEAWLDEGVNQYANGLVMDTLYGEGKSGIDWGGFQAGYLAVTRAGASSAADIPAPIGTRSHEFPDWSSYGDATYTKTAFALSTLESIVGKDQFAQAMRAYAQRYAFRHPTGRQFFAALEESLGRDLSWFWKPAFYGIGAVRFVTRDITCRKQHEPRGVFGRGPDRKTVTPEDAPLLDRWSCDILVANLGTVPAPTDVRIEFADGTVTTERWQALFTQLWQLIQVEHDEPVTRVIIDPEGQILLNDSLLEREQRTAARAAPAQRAGARMSFWTQTAMQVLGL